MNRSNDVHCNNATGFARRFTVGLFTVVVCAAATLWLNCASTGMAAQSVPPDIIATVQGSKTFDDGVGFSWGIDGKVFAIARTQDRGKTWVKLELNQNLFEPDDPSEAPATVQDQVHVNFADSNHGWLVWSDEDSVLTIQSTADAGKTWTQTFTLETDAVVDRELLPGPGRSVMLAEMPEGMMHTTMVTIATDDNGQSWTASTFSGDGVSDMAFRSPTDGFAAINLPAAAGLSIYRTADGGKSWTELEAPLPPSLPVDSIEGTTPGAFTFTGGQKMTGELLVEFYTDSGKVKIVYRTSDGGKTWTPAQ